MGNKKIKFKFNDTLQTALFLDRDLYKKISLQDFFNLFDAFMADKELENLAPRTIKEYYNNLRYLKKYIDENLQSEYDCIPIETALFKSYMYYMLNEKKYSPYTVNLRIRNLKCYLRWLYINNYLKENISIKIKLVKTPLDTVKPLTDLEVKKLLMVCNIGTYAGFRDYTAMLLILDCGIRVGELVELRVDDADLKGGFITVRAEVAKTRISRQLPISKRTCKLLRELKECSLENQTSYLFQSTYGGKIKKQNLMISFRRLGEKANLGKRCTPYVFRHTFATNAVKAGIMDMFTLQRIMGHASLNTTRRYVQLETKDLKRKHTKANPIDRFFRGGRI